MLVCIEIRISYTFHSILQISPNVRQKSKSKKPAVLSSRTLSLVAQKIGSSSGSSAIKPVIQTGIRTSSRAPKRQPTAVNKVDRERIIFVRTHLEAQKFAQIGASAIKWELSKSGHGFPSDRTINRVLKKEGLVKKNFVHSQRC